MRTYRLRRSTTGRRRLDGQPAGDGGFQVTVPTSFVRMACEALDCDADRVRFAVYWDAEQHALIYVPTEERGSGTLPLDPRR